jgi:hypothetical protein
VTARTIETATKSRRKRIFIGWLQGWSSAIMPESGPVCPTMPDGSASSHLYRPKLATVLAEGYNLGCFRRDMLAALTVGIVAL